MSAILYYLPGSTPPSVSALVAAGFPHYAIAQLPGGLCDGPDDKRGYIFTLHKPPHPEGREPAIGYTEKKQTWMKAEGGKWWLGFEDDHRPRPVDLQRDRTVAGTTVQLDDDNHWLIPVIRDFDGTPRVDAVIKVDENGKVYTDQPAKAYVCLWSAMQKTLAMAANPQLPHMDEDELTEMICAALTLNYRVGKYEMGLLGALTTGNMIEVFKVLAGMESDEAT